MRRRTTIALAAGCAALALPGAAHATYPGGSGNIAVIESNSDRGGEGDTDLRLLRRGGSVLVGSLQHCAFHEFTDSPDERFCPSSPSFSKSGRKLTFAIDDRIAVANADGSGRVVLPRLTDADSEPAWTRRGGLLFTGRRNGRRNLYLVRADGTGLRQLTQDGGRSGAYSNRGLVAYARGSSVRLIRPDGTRGRRFAAGDLPDFSPSGRTVVYEARGAVYRKRVRRGGRRRRVVRQGGDPVFSPSGRRVLYVRQSADGGRNSLVTVTPRGKRRRTLFRSIHLSSAGASSLFGPAWQPRR